MTGDAIGGQSRVALNEQAGNPRQAGVLQISIGFIITTLQFDPDAEIVAVVATTERGFARMPGPLIEVYELDERSAAVDQQVRRNPQPPELFEEGVSVTVQRVAEQRLDVAATELAWWQTDVVDHQQVYLSTRGTLLTVVTGADLGRRQPAIADRQAVFVARRGALSHRGNMIAQPATIAALFPHGITMQPVTPEYIQECVNRALAEDVGDGDISAALIAAESTARARIVCREAGVLCGRDWAEQVFAQLDAGVELRWQFEDGDALNPGDVLVTLQGNARAILTGERTALNFLQLLSGTASLCRRYADMVESTGVRLLDTRKTLPGLRLAQKYAVTCGGCYNHRLGLYDAYLIKENHIQACGSIAAAVTRAREQHPDRLLEVEVEDLAELEEALAAGCERIMLDNFSPSLLCEAVALTAGRAELEASGGISDDTLLEVAETGVDFISIGALTKDVTALDLSLRFD